MIDKLKQQHRVKKEKEEFILRRSCGQRASKFYQSELHGPNFMGKYGNHTTYLVRTFQKGETLNSCISEKCASGTGLGNMRN